jgi:hypothetical protein
MNETRMALEREIEQLLKDMYLCTPDSEGYKEQTERLSKLYELKIKEDQAQEELKLKAQQLGEGKKDRWVKVLVDGACLLVPVGFNWIWMRRGFKFEETGAFTSTTFRNLFGRFRIGK